MGLRATGVPANEGFGLGWGRRRSRSGHRPRSIEPLRAECTRHLPRSPGQDAGGARGTAARGRAGPARRHPHRQPRLLVTSPTGGMQKPGSGLAERKSFPRGRRPTVLEGWVALLTGDAAQALIEFERVGGSGSLAGASVALHALGRDRESRDALARLEREYPDALIAIAGARAWRGDLDGGFAVLDEAIQAKHQRLWLLRTSAASAPAPLRPSVPRAAPEAGVPRGGTVG